MYNWLPIPKPGWMLAFALVLSALVLALGVWLPYHREQVAIREIERLRGHVWTEKGGPDWLRGLVGDEWMVGFDHVHIVSFTDVPIGGDELKYLSECAQLQGLFLDLTEVSDAGLIHVTDLPKLYALSLMHTQVSDAGLQHLSGLMNLRHLNLRDTQVTNEGAEALQQKLPHCKINR